MTADPGTRYIPEADFVLRIDELLEKSLPERTIPWPASPPPGWANWFRPRRIVDLGAGVGGLTHSILVRLGQWGCLDALEQVVLIEGERGLLPGGEAALKERLSRQARNALTQGKDRDRMIDISFASIELHEDAQGNGIVIPVLEPYRDTDLIVASHLTYYFGDGSGRELVSCLAARYLSAAGRLWCVLRKHACPIYEARTRMLSELGVSDIKPFDYAEHFESKVLPHLPNLAVLAAADWGYLGSPGFSGRSEAAHLLMWRQAPSYIPTDPYQRAVADIAMENEALFVERHFILGKRT